MKKILLIILAVIMVAGIAGCTNSGGDDEFLIVTSFNPIYALVLNITYGAEGVRVENMAANHAGCLHHYQLTTGDMNSLSRSDIFIINGGGMERFLERAMQAVGGLNVLDSSYGIDLLPGGHFHDHECEHDYVDDHAEPNSHIWLSIRNAIVQVTNIRDGLMESDPVNADIYEQNAAAFIEQLHALDAEFSEALADAYGTPVLSFHEGLMYLAADYNITIAEIIESEPGVSPDPATLARIIARVRRDNIDVIFTEPQYAGTTARVISDETGARIFTIDSLVTGQINRDSYINIMRENLAVIVEAIQLTMDN